jgi:uncharacterized protein YdeI (BOF family)
MAHHLLSAVVVAGATATMLAVAPAPQDPPPAKTKVDANKPVTMNGCIVRDMTSTSQYMFTDNTDGSKYRLSGRDVSKFMGQPLQIFGVVDTKRLKVVGGLTPSPNVAAQAGAIDPGKAAVAALGGGTTGSGSPDLPTFKVARVSAARGECRK